MDQEMVCTNDDGSCAIPPPEPTRTAQAYVPSLYERVRMPARVDPPASHLTVPDEVLAALEQMKRQRCEKEDEDDEGTPRRMAGEPAPQRRCPHTAGAALCTHFLREARTLQPEQCPAVAMKRTRESGELSCAMQGVHVLEHKRLKNGCRGMNV